MKNDSAFAFLEQFEKADKNISNWPNWMKESAIVASASFKRTGQQNELAGTRHRTRDSSAIIKNKRESD